MFKWHLVQGEDYRRSIKWARNTPSPLDVICREQELKLGLRKPGETREQAIARLKKQ